MDAVIHNAGVYLEPSRSTTADGHAKTLAVNTLAPYMLTALIDRPDRLIYLSSGLHRAGAGSLGDIDWTGRRWNAAQAYSESKLHVTALALTLARVWPDVLSNAVDPGWVPTKMGGAGATDDLEGIPHADMARRLQRRSRSRERRLLVHRQRQTPAPEARDPAFQDQLMDRLAALTGVALLSAAVASSRIRGEPGPERQAKERRDDERVPQRMGPTRFGRGRSIRCRPPRWNKRRCCCWHQDGGLILAVRVARSPR